MSNSNEVSRKGDSCYIRERAVSSARMPVPKKAAKPIAVCCDLPVDLVANRNCWMLTTITFKPLAQEFPAVWTTNRKDMQGLHRRFLSGFCTRRTGWPEDRVGGGTRLQRISRRAMMERRHTSPPQERVPGSAAHPRSAAAVLLVSEKSEPRPIRTGGI